MAVNKTLKTRLELVGGQKLVKEFEAVGAAGDNAMERIDREAAKAKREVERLEKELVKLEALAQGIRASIKIEDGKQASKAQRKALSYAADIEARVKSAKAELAARKDILELGAGQGLGALVGGAGEFKASKIAKEISTAVERARTAPSLKESLHLFNLEEVEQAAAKVAASAERASRNISEGYGKAATAREREIENAARVERNAGLARMREERRAAKAAADARSDELKAATTSSKLKQVEARAAVAASAADEAASKARAKSAKATAAEQKALDAESRVKKAADEKAAAERKAKSSLLERVADERSEKRLDTLHKKLRGDLGGDAKAIAAVQKSFDEYATASIERQMGARVLAARRYGEAMLEVERQIEAKRLKNSKFQFSPVERAKRLRATGSDLARFGGNVDGRLKDVQLPSLAKDFDRKVGLAGRAISRLQGLFGGAAREGKKLGTASEGAAKSVLKVAGTRAIKGVTTLSSGFKSAFTNAKSFGVALRQVEGALGNTALRAGVAGIIGVLGVGLAALGGAAVAGGIAALAGFAAFNAAGIKRVGDAFGYSAKGISELKYAAQALGVDFDTVQQGLSGLGDAAQKIADGDQSMANAAKNLNDIGVSVNTLVRGPGGYWQVGPLKTSAQLLNDIIAQLDKIQDPRLRAEYRDTLAKQLGIEDLSPLLKKGAAGLRTLAAEGRHLGAVATDGMAGAAEKLERSFLRLWNSVVGVAYQLVERVVPTLVPIIDAITSWIVKNQEWLADWMVKIFRYLMDVGRSFWDLWKESNFSASIAWMFESIEWTKTFWKWLMKVTRAIGTMWDLLKRGYEQARPALEAFAKYFGLDGAFEAAVVIVGSSLLGVFTLLASVMRLAGAGVAIVAGLFTRLLLPAIGWMLAGLAAIVGWPLALLAGFGVLAAYWDDVAGLFDKAWGHFMAAFPTIGKWLEEKFHELTQPFAGLYERIRNLVDPVKDLASWFTELMRTLNIDIGDLAFAVGMGVLASKVSTAAVALVSAWRALSTLSLAAALAGSPVGWLVGFATLLGILTYKVLEWADSMGAISSVIDKITGQTGERDRIAAGIRERDDAYLRAKAANGGRIPSLPAYASGGRVRGPGTGTSDSILARLSRGEHVITARAANYWGHGFLDNLNSLSLPLPGFAEGGAVEIAGPAPAGRPVYVTLPSGDMIPMTSSAPDLEARLARGNRVRAAASQSWKR